MTVQQQTRLIANCIALLEQMDLLLGRIDSNVYSSTSPLSPRGSIGGHLRHCLEFFQSYLDGVQIGRINYNLRKREQLTEQDCSFARSRLHEIVAKLHAISTYYRSRPLLVSTEDYGLSPTSWCVSSVVRELEFLQSHTIHHYSLIAMLLRLHGIEPGPEFGVAPSTLKHWREEVACAR